MKNNLVARRPLAYAVWPALLLAPAAVGGLVWALVRGGERGLLAASVLALLTVLAAAWVLRARAARRQQAALDAYAEREIARAPRRRASRG